MKHLLSLILLTFLFACSHTQDTNYAAEKTTPFHAVKWKGDVALLLIENQWYELISFQGKSGEELLEQCKLVYPRKWKQRFGEDFVEFLLSVGIKPQKTDQFTLKTSEGEIIQKELSFDESKRSAVRNYFRENYADKEENLLDFQKEIDREAMLEDLESLRASIHSAYSYADRLGVDTDAEIEKIKQSLPASSSVQDFAIRVQELILKYGDGHSRVDKLDFKQYGLLPFNTAAFGNKIIAYEEGQLLVADFPYLTAINGIEINELLETTFRFKLPKVAEHTQKAWGANYLKYIGFILQKHGVKAEKLDLQLSNEAGEKQRIELALRYPEPKEEKGALALYQEMSSWNSFEYKILKDEIGYIKIGDMLTMDPESIVKDIMEEIAKTRGIIIDVRGNGGGGRMTTKALLPYFLSESQSPVIGNLAKRRMDVDIDLKEGVIKKRFLYPLSSAEYEEEDRKAIQAFLKNFEPKWEYEEDKYSDWHFFLLKHQADKKLYTYPVIILQDEFCFSATDIFLASFDQLDNVKLMGTQSGGGSGKAEDHLLPQSRLEVRLSSIISFQPNGHLFEGMGVEPDFHVEPKSYTDILGSTDSQLDAAIEYIKANR